jgi:hypothetical protein
LLGISILILAILIQISFTMRRMGLPRLHGLFAFKPQHLLSF